MVVLYYVHWCLLLLWSFYPVCHSDIDDNTVARAKEGEWVALRGSDNEEVVKVAWMRDVGTTFDKAEEFCKQDHSHLTSVLSENEMKFIGELVARIFRLEGGDHPEVRALTGLRREGALKWIDGSPTDFVRESYKSLEAGEDGPFCHYIEAKESESYRVSWKTLNCAPLLEDYLVCRK